MFNVGERIKEIRNAKGIKGLYVAKQAGFSHPFLYGIEKGTRKCSLENLEKICDALDISLSDFFADEQPTQSPEIIRLVKAAEKLSPEQIELITAMINGMKDKQ